MDKKALSVGRSERKYNDFDKQFVIKERNFVEYVDFHCGIELI